jgi:hypothetical protein
MHIEAAFRAVEREVLEFALEVGLHLQEFQPQHLGVGDERIGPAMLNPDQVVDEVVGFRCLLGDGLSSCSRMSRSRRAMVRKG